MSIKSYIFLAYYLILCIQYNFRIAEALIGENVRPAREREFEYVVSIERIVNENDNSTDIPENNHECSGILVSRRDVLTASHCFRRLMIEDIVVIVGTIDLRGGNRYRTLWWLSYEEWSDEMDIEPESAFNDLAILRLSESIPRHIRPVSLSFRSNAETYGLVAQTVGWGMAPNGDMDRFLKTVQVRVLTHAECSRRISVRVRQSTSLGQNLLCTIAQPYALLRKGDSGGPLVYNGLLIGINKGTCLFPNLCSHPDKLNIHMSVGYYKRFIRDIIYNF